MQSRAEPLDRLDLSIIDVMQRDPRIPWRSLAGLVGTDAATAARRWERMEGEGLAWITATSSAEHLGATAIAEFGCDPGRLLEVADRAAREPMISSIDITAGRRDLIATLIAGDDAELTAYILGPLGDIPGVRELRTHVVDSSLRLGSDWRLQLLPPRQLERMPRPRRPRAGSAKRVDPVLRERIRGLLERDGRISHTALGEALGISAQRAGDALARLRCGGEILLRVDLAQHASNWPVAAWYFIQAPAATVLSAGTALADMSSVQYAATATGPFGLLVAAAAARKEEVLHIEAELERRLPRARIVDRSIVLRVHKHLGRLTDPEGRALPVAG